METINKYKVRVTDNCGNVRMVEFRNVHFQLEDNVVIVRERPTHKIKAVYPITYSLEISDVTNGDSSN